MKSRKYLKFGILAIILIFVVSYILYEKGVFGPQKVVGAQVAVGTLKPTVFGIGTVDAKMNFNVGPTQTGKILKLYVDQGDYVKAGQIIGEMDPGDLEQNIASAHAVLVNSQYSAETAKAQIQAAESVNELAQVTAARHAKLFESGAISRESLESKQKDAQVAQASLDSAISTYQAAQSRVAQAVADHQKMMEQKKDILLISPVDGVVVSRQTEKGSTVIAGQTVFNIIDPKTLWVQTRIDQSRFSGIEIGQTAEIRLRSHKEALQGEVARLQVQGDTVTEERFIDIKINGAPAKILLGDSADVTIQLPVVENALYVPAAAVKTIDGADCVWVVKNEKVHSRKVKTGVQTVEGEVQILEGLEKDKTVITYSKAQLVEGTKVRLVPTL